MIGVHPVDVVKTRLQFQGELAGTSGNKKYSGVLSSLVQIGRREGVAGLYRGLISAYALQVRYVRVKPIALAEFYLRVRIALQQRGLVYMALLRPHG